MMERIEKYLKEVGTYVLATVEGNEPRVRPFGTVMIFDGKLCIQTGKKKDVYRQLMANPKAEICAYAQGSWLRIRGDLVELDSRDARKAMLDAYPSLRAMYAEDDGNTVILAFQNATAVLSSFTQAPITVEL